MKNYTITVNGTAYSVMVEEGAPSASFASPVAAPVQRTAPVAAAAPAPAAPAAPAAKVQGTQGAIEVAASVPGKVFKISSQVGQALKAGDAVVVLEAMKMEIPVVAPKDGTVASINVGVGDPVETGDLLATLN